LVCARCQRFEWSPHPLQSPVALQAAATGHGRPGGKPCVGRSASHVSAQTTPPCFSVRSGAQKPRKPTHSLPLWNVRALIAHAVTWVREADEALIRSVGSGHREGRCREQDGAVGGPWADTRAGSVSGFLLPTFLCRGKEK
jgi:hypothetical protein